MRSTLQTKMIGTIELSIVMVMGTKNYNSSIAGPEKRPIVRTFNDLKRDTITVVV
jgi:hypothetical protein